VATRMEKTLAYIARAEELHILAAGAPSAEVRLEYLTLAKAWTDLADERRQFLFEARPTKLH
jgi:hypothetical protein